MHLRKADSRKKKKKEAAACLCVQCVCDPGDVVMKVFKPKRVGLTLTLDSEDHALTDV